MRKTLDVARLLALLTLPIVLTDCRACGAGSSGTSSGASGTSGASGGGGTPAATAFVVDCKAAPKDISPLIYGIGFDITGYSDWKEPRQWELGPSARRLGGNQASRYNWEQGNGTAFNHGQDWIFANNGAPDATEPFYVTFMTENAAKGATSAIEIPMLGWVAKDMTSASFPIAKYGGQKVTDQGRAAGNGLRPDGSEIPPPPPETTSVKSTPEMAARYVKAIKALHQKLNAKGPRIYMLDNEPALWNSTHRDVHPEPLGYDELMKLTKEYATVIRDNDPEGLIAGPTAYGWMEYNFSAKDAKAGAHLKPDRRAHDDLPLIAWYLRELKAHEQKTGKKLLDLLDVHFYPQAEGVGLSKEGKTDMTTSAIRMRSPRALWDPTYVDESWIKEPIKLIPRLREWIDKYYPGIEIQIGEWNYGAEGDISGGLATAETLGRFADGKVKSAFYWPYPHLDTAAFWAFRAFRNFDGKGGRFLDQLAPATSVENTSLWASRDASGKHVVMVMLNFSGFRSVDKGIALDSCGTVDSAKVYTYTKQEGSLKEGKVEKSGGAVTASFPPYSISVVDVVLK